MTDKELQARFESDYKTACESFDDEYPSAIIEIHGRRGVAFYCGDNEKNPYTSGTIIVWWSNSEVGFLPREFKLVAYNAFDAYNEGYNAAYDRK